MQRRLITQFAAVAMVGLMFVACTTAPIVNPSVSLTSQPGRTTADVTNAIKAAGIRYGWEMVESGPGVITGTIHVRKHTAVVDISYDAESYHIEYRDSEQLDHLGNEIHKNYNRWVRNLQLEINSQLGQAE